MPRRPHRPPQRRAASRASTHRPEPRPGFESGTQRPRPDGGDDTDRRAPATGLHAALFPGDGGDAIPIPSYRAVELVDGEERLPFTVAMLGSRDTITGYVRIADNAIFISRPEKKDHIRSTLDPRFAPVTKIVALPEDPT